MLAFGLDLQKEATCWGVQILRHGHRACHCAWMAFEEWAVGGGRKALGQQRWTKGSVRPMLMGPVATSTRQ